jgi:D-galactarolactone cycloisomerase
MKELGAKPETVVTGLRAQDISYPQLRVVSVRIHQLSARLREPFGWSLNWTSTRSATLVEVVTDAGITGWGEGYCDVNLLAERQERIIGRSPFEVEAIYEEMRLPGGPQRRPGACATPGLDIALWDVIGKALGMSVSALLGHQYRRHVLPYVTALYRKESADLCRALAEEARAWVNAGYRAIKMKTGYSPETDFRAVAAVREAIGPDTALAIDSNCAYDAGTALQLGARLEPFNLMWWEEPVLAEDLEGYSRLRQGLRIPLAAGETHPVDWLVRNYVQTRLIDILQPDLGNIGLTGARLLTHLCHFNSIRLVPHNWGTAVHTAAVLQWLATCPPLTPALNPPEPMLEFDQTEHPFRDAIISEKICPERPGGPVPVPPGPGLGITVIPEVVAEFRANLFEIPA